MKPNKELLEQYRQITEASPRNMEDSIRRHLEEQCPKFIPEKLDGCIAYVTECAREILDGKNGAVSDDACYKIARDYFNEELWKDDEKKESPKKPKKAAAASDLELTEPTPDPEPETPQETQETAPAPKPEEGQCSLFDLAGFAQ